MNSATELEFTTPYILNDAFRGLGREERAKSLFEPMGLGVANVEV